MNCTKEKVYIRTINCNETRRNLPATMMEAVENHAPIFIARQNGEACVLMSLKEYNSLEEAAYLLRFPANARRLMDPIDSLKSDKGTEKDITE